MKPKERVYAALRGNRRTGSRSSCGFTRTRARRLASAVGGPAACVDVVLGNDVRMTWVNNNYCMEGIVHEHDGEGHVDPWGIRWVKEGPYNQIAAFPLADASPEEVLALPLSRPASGGTAGQDGPAGGRTRTSTSSAATFRRTCSRCTGGCGAWSKRCWTWRRARSWPTRCSAAAAISPCELAEAACRRFPLDWLWTGDDVAGQRSLMMSPPPGGAMIKPHLQRAFDVGKRHGLCVAYHCCGALRPIIPDLVEMGLDVLNPVQCNCPGMDPLELKREFGAALDLHGRRRHAGAAAARHAGRGPPRDARADRRHDRRRRRLHPGRLPHHPAGNPHGQHLRHVPGSRRDPRRSVRPRSQCARRLSVVSP